MLRRKARQFVSDLIESLDSDSWSIGGVDGQPALSCENLYLVMRSLRLSNEVCIEVCIIPVANVTAKTVVWLPALQRWRLRRAVRLYLIKRAHELVPVSGL